MKRFGLVRLGNCARCRRAVAFLKSEDGEHGLAIPIESEKARELLSRYRETDGEKFLADLLLLFLARSPSVLRQVVLDCDRGGFLSAKIDITIEGKAESFSCSPEEGLGLAVAAKIPLYVAERTLEQTHLFHPVEMESESTDPLEPKPKPTFH
jgi:bifunctional DNase/RNase